MQFPNASDCEQLLSLIQHEPRFNLTGSKPQHGQGQHGSGAVGQEAVGQHGSTHTLAPTHINIGGIDVVISIRVLLREDHSVLVICGGWRM